MHINKEGRPPGCLAGATAGNRASHRAGAIRGNPKVARGNPESSKTLVGGRETSYPTGGHPKINDLTNRLRLGKRKLPNLSFFFLLSLSLSLSLSFKSVVKIPSPHAAYVTRRT
ncbi:hypothetical protein ALC56_14221 [Trachymyrmex septentrionalis]|uniref:Uncharacterized protein n=1 Tax=Trachymyrmex septentrionalis TaxID=34720 RepID=A0A195ESW2_9HYME|nr:hypothetical protein ALC56_14221 [Trachymyrmex septentrionalis]